VFVFWFEVKGFEGSKAETLAAIRWREPGHELGKAIFLVDNVHGIDVGIMRQEEVHTDIKYQHAYKR
jgi:hypothetical protein